MDKTKKSVSKSVMNKISSGKVTMRPQFYFVLLSVVSTGAIVGSVMALAYSSSILFFWWRIQTAETYARGARANLEQAISSFPWWSLILMIVMFLLATWLIRKHGRMYRLKTSIVFLALIILALITSLGLSYFDIGGRHFNGRANNQGRRLHKRQ